MGGSGLRNPSGSPLRWDLAARTGFRSGRAFQRCRQPFVPHWRPGTEPSRHSDLRDATLPRMRFFQRSAYLLLMLIGFVSLVEARVVRVEITSRKDVLGGQSFGKRMVESFLTPCSPCWRKLPCFFPH